MGKAGLYPTASIVTGEEKLTGITSDTAKEYKQFPVPLLAQQIQAEALDLGITTHNSLTLVDVDTTFDTEKGIFVGNSGGWNIDAGITLTIKSKITVFENKQIFFGDGDVRFETGAVEKINTTWFGAVPDAVASAVPFFRKAIDTAINSQGSSIVYIPEGKYLIDAPIYPRYYDSGVLQFFNLTIEGAQSAYSKQEGKGGVTWLEAPNQIPFVFGLQGCRGVTVKNMAITGYIDEPTKEDLIELTEEELLIKYTTETELKQYAPLCAIVLDPLMDMEGAGNLADGYNHSDLVYDNGLSSSRVRIEGVHIAKFPVSVALTPNGTTLQNDSVRITNCHFKDGIASVVVGQNQSRTVIIDDVDISRFKWAFAGDLYGALTGIIPEISNIKISDGTAWIFRCNGTQSYVNISHLYAEGLYGIGYSASNWHPIGINNSTIKLQDKLDSAKKGFINPCILYTDNAKFDSCTISIGGAYTIKEPLIFFVDRLTFDNCYLDTPPINIGASVNSKFGFEGRNNKYRESKLPPETTWDIAKMNGKTSELIVYNGEVLDSSGAPLLYGDDVIRSSYTIPVADTSLYAETTVVGIEVTSEGDFAFARIEDMPYPIGSINSNTAIGQIISGGIVTNTSITIFSNLLPQANITLDVVTLSNTSSGSTPVEIEEEVNWNMQNTTKTIAHGLSATEYLTIREVSCTIYNDSDVTPRLGHDLTKDGDVQWDDTNFTLTGYDGATTSPLGINFFTGVDYNDGAGIRGWLRYTYIPD